MSCFYNIFQPAHMVGLETNESFTGVAVSSEATTECGVRL